MSWYFYLIFYWNGIKKQISNKFVQCTGISTKLWALIRIECTCNSKILFSYNMSSYNTKHKHRERQLNIENALGNTSWSNAVKSTPP